ncbi:MAG TPA: TonB-dependent receptor [Longimicrobium sp.]|nr:TonB-dependent receptor [Longimicrobium sp.]
MKVPRIRRHALAMAVAALPILAPPLPAQAPARAGARGAGEVLGTIVDAQSELPLAGARITLEPLSGAPPLGTRTDAEGRYRFTVPPGPYRLTVRRLGYLENSVDVLLRGPATAAVSVALRVAPVRLQPLAATASLAAARANPFQAGGAGDGRARIDAERMRQRTQLAPDVRLVTRSDVEAAVPLAESDLFRGIQRVPGVAARDEYSAELLTRGGNWDQTRVFFDGVPLFNPVHASGLFSGPSTESVGSVLLFPGAQPLGTGGGAAASLELRSRRGGDAGPVSGSGDLSMASARVALDGAAGPQRWMVSARRSHLPRLTDQVEARGRGEDVWTTRRFADLAARYDLRLGAGRALEASALWQEDVLGDGPETDWIRGSAPRWGSLAARATLRAPVGPLDGRVTVGGSGFDAAVRDTGVARPRPAALISWPTLVSTRSGVRHLFVDARADAPAAAGTAPRWSLGGGVVRQEVRYEGPPVFPADSALPPTLLRLDGSLGYGYAWGERRFHPAPRVTVEAGLRADAGARAVSTPAVRVAPRIAARWEVSPRFSASLAAGRSWHTLQAGPELQEQSITQHLWLLAGTAAGAVRSDVVTVGAERWMGAWLASATAYARRSDGVALRDPTPGGVMGRQGFVAGRLGARGAELSVRKLAGAWTGAASYSLGGATLRAGGRAFPTESDRRQVLNLEAGAAVGAGVRVGAAFTASSGAAYTRFFGGLASCRQGVCQWEELPAAGEPGALRAPGFASLDLSAEWSHRFGGVRVGAYAQLHNALDRENPARYHRSILYRNCGYGEPDAAGGCIHDVYGRGLPRLPLAGVRLSF